MYEWVYFLAWIILTIGFMQKDFGIVTIAGFFLVVLGVYLFSNTFVGDLSYSLGIVHIGVGLYISFRSSIELLNLKGGK